MKMKRSYNPGPKVKRWFLPILGGAVVVLSLAAPSSAKAQCYYYAKMIPCHYATDVTKHDYCPGFEGSYVQGYLVYTSSYASVGSCVVAPYGNGSAQSSSAFSGSCTYNYENLLCGKTYKGSKSSSVNLNNCLGSCGG